MNYRKDAKRFIPFVDFKCESEYLEREKKTLRYFVQGSTQKTWIYKDGKTHATVHLPLNIYGILNEHIKPGRYIRTIVAAMGTP